MARDGAPRGRLLGLEVRPVFIEVFAQHGRAVGIELNALGWGTAEEAPGGMAPFAVKVKLVWLDRRFFLCGRRHDERIGFPRHHLLLPFGFLESRSSSLYDFADGRPLNDLMAREPDSGLEL